MNPLAMLALRFITGKGSTLLTEFAAAVRRFKALSPTDAEVQALPDDEAAIAAFARAVDAGLEENAAIRDRLSARLAREADDDGA